MTKLFNSALEFEQAFPQSDVPMMSIGTTHLLKAFAQPNLAIDQLPTILEQSPTIAAKLLALANSAWSAPASPITRLDSACTRLGLNVVRSVGVALAVSSPFNTSRCPNFHAGQFWARTLLIAEATTLLIPCITPPPAIDIGTARTAALFHNLGLLFLVHNFHQETNQAFLRKQTNEDLVLNELLNETLGINTSDAATLLAKKWHLPNALAATMMAYQDMQYQGTEWPTVASVGLAVTAVGAIETQGSFTSPKHPYLTLDSSKLKPVTSQLLRTQVAINQLAQSIRW
ncbi:HDOD domain-containing protein [Thalassolituus sp.]|jgi:HD-like signal output (HDOD) protein|uniref:HDOD domain-containing protein n=1 Tax=Thalassolituus sp. TaxID=2030822 RepID=UPI002A7F9072|nr:HDOD domain-containing protein [Thalassolituus sp.]